MIWRKDFTQTTRFILDSEDETDDNLYMNTVTLTEYYLFGIKVAESYYDIFDKSTYKPIEEEATDTVAIGFTKKKKE